MAADGIQIIKTPVQAPNVNAVAERWVRTVRHEWLDWMLIWGRRHLERVLDEYVRHYNDERAHRGSRFDRSVLQSLSGDGLRHPATGASSARHCLFTPSG